MQELKITDPSYRLYTLSTEDAQEIAKDKIGRELTAAELARVEKALSNGIQWADYMTVAVDVAVEGN